MIPILFTIGPIKIYTFGVFLVLAFFWGSFFLWKNIRLTSKKEEEIFDAIFISLFGSLFFARLFYVILNFSDFGFDILKFILINGYPGLSLIGGLFGGWLTFFIFSKIKKIGFKETVDYLVPPLFLALVFGKLGSFFAGVEVGAKTNFFLRVYYLGFEGARHLTSFYEAILFTFGVFFSQKILLAIRRQTFFLGFNFLFFLFYFSLVNLLTDSLKEQHLSFWGISFNFFVSFIIFFILLIYFIYYLSHQKKFQEKILEFLKGLQVVIFAYGKTIYSKFIKSISSKIKTRKEKA